MKAQGTADRSWWLVEYDTDPIPGESGRIAHKALVGAATIPFAVAELLASYTEPAAVRVLSVVPSGVDTVAYDGMLVS